MSTVSRQQILGLAVILAALTTFVAYRTFFVKATTITDGREPVGTSGSRKVAVANRDIQPLELLDRSMFHLVELKPEEEPPKDAIRALGTFDGQVATNFIAKNEPVKKTDVAYPDARFGMAFQVPSGYRAMTVPVNPVSGLAGFLKPGNRVDVLATFDTRGEAVTRTVIQDVVILAYGREIREEKKDGATAEEKESEAQPADTATLLVSPAQAEPLALAAARAKLSLALRGIKEESPLARTPGVLEHQVTRVPRETQPGSTSPREPRTPPSKEASRPSHEIETQAREPVAPPMRSILVIRGTRQEIVQVPQ